MPQFTTIKQVRKGFWNDHPQYKDEFIKGQRQNDYRVDIRMAFVDYVERLHRAGDISDSLVQKVTL